MRMLFVSPSYYPHVGGVEYVVKSIAERLAKMGHEVTVLAGEPNTDKPVEEEINNVHVTRWPVWSPGGAYHIPKRRGELDEWLRRASRNVDVVHLHNVHSVFTIYALHVLRDHGVRKVLTPHYHGTGHTVFRRFLWVFWRGLCRDLVRYVDTVHAVSDYEAGLIARDFGVEPVVIGHGVEEWISGVGWRPEDYVMYSGRIEKYKNIHRLGNIVKILNSRYSYSLKLKVFGDGTYKSRLEKHLEKLGIEFYIHPPQPYGKYIEALSHARLFALISEKEAFGLTVNEANAIGVPVVVAEPWGRNFSDRPRTLVVSLSESDEAIAEKIAHLLETAHREPKPVVPSWSEVASIYLERLYKICE
mgnify:CR=1 FL=1